MFKVVKNFFKARPMLANMVTYGTMYTVAEASQQTIMNLDSPQKKIDWDIIGRYGVISVGILGPTLFYWYRFLDNALPSITHKTVISKVLIDQAIAGSGSISVFFTADSTQGHERTMWSRTKEVFRTRPLLMNMVSFGTMYVGAEVTQQYILTRKSPDKPINWESVRRYAIIGICGIGPALFYWYRLLDRLVPGAARKDVVKKVLSDQLISSTTCLGIFFTGMSILEGKEDIFAELKAKFFSTYTLSCCFWLPAQAINFALLPPYTRVAFVGVASFVWVNVLCLVKRQEFTKEEQKAALSLPVSGGK